jgi:hypothetical protein
MELSTVNSSFCLQVPQNDCLRLRSMKVTLILDRAGDLHCALGLQILSSQNS